MQKGTVVSKWGDFRDITHKIRLRIGFTNNHISWKKAPATFGKHNLMIQGHPVMEDWERLYMKELAHIATSMGGVVLEVGFGMGISASFISEADIKKHIIIEANNDVIGKAIEFKKKSKKAIKIIKGFWEDVMDMIPDGSLDGILFDTYPLTELEVHKNHFKFFEIAYKKLRRGGVFTYYSDEPNKYHSNHLKKLMEAGFSRKNISYKIVKVNPPLNCKYWKSKTIMAPIVYK